MKKYKYPITLAIGDPHAEPGHSNERFDALGNIILERQPDNIVNIGDFTTCDSVSSHTHKSMVLREGMRLSDDIAAGKDAYDRMMAPMNAFNKRRKSAHKKVYNPHKFWLNANHEDRVWRYIQDKPELLGFIPHTDLLGVAEDGWNIVNYRNYIFLNGIGFTHIPMCKRVCQPISGEYVCRRAADMENQTTVFGHTHRLGVHESKRNGGELVQGINIGWFGDFVPGYVVGNEGKLDWWGGLVFLHHIAPGLVDIETISMDRIKKEYL